MRALSKFMQQRLDDLPGSAHGRQAATIFRLPSQVRRDKANRFEPAVISIGPFHRGGGGRYRAMEEHKWRYLYDFRHRFAAANMNVGHLVQEMSNLESRARRCYSEQPHGLDSDEFVMMMVLDGCFILEYFFKLKHDGSLYDVLAETGWNSSYITRDLVMMENQIPFFILDKLCSLTPLAGVGNAGGRDGVPEDMLVFLAAQLAVPGLSPNPALQPPVEIHHLLHVCHHYLVPRQEPATVINMHRLHHGHPINPGVDEAALVLPCATKLRDAGVRFRKMWLPLQSSGQRNWLNVTFRRGVLEIPSLSISDTSKTLFMNLVAFEQCRVGDRNNHLSSFMWFMDSIINTTEDVDILEKCGIVRSLVSSDEEISVFFNQLGQDCALTPDHYLTDVFQKLNVYDNSWWHKHRAKLIHDYFSSPWSAISLIAAVILLLLTAAQTFLTAFPPQKWQVSLGVDVDLKNMYKFVSTN